MSISDWKTPTIRVSDTTLDCADGTAEVTVVVGAITDGANTPYAVSIWSTRGLHDTQISNRQFATFSATTAGEMVRNVHRFVISCDKNCHVQGDGGTSRESPTEIYAYAEEWHGYEWPTGVFPDVKSGDIDVSCESKIPARSERR